MSYRFVYRILLLLLCSCCGAKAAPLIMSREAVLLDFTPGSGYLYRYSYTLTGAVLQANQEIDIRFDPVNYTRLSNAVAGPGFDVLLLQPFNPPGLPGDFSILVLIDNPSLLAPFRVDALYVGQGPPGPQEFYINQLDSEGRITGVLASGLAQEQVPEPAAWTLGVLGMASFGTLRALRKRIRRAA